MPPQTKKHLGMTLERIKELIDLVAGAAMAELEIEEDGTKIRIVRHACAPADGPRRAPVHEPQAIAPSAAKQNAAIGSDPPPRAVVAAPLFGVFHRQASPGAAPFVEVGTAVEAGQQLCVIEAMKVFNAVHAAGPGRVAAILAENGREVSPGQPLFRIDRGA
jgi:acetyl-CoA carboxylase biotin carboxyl carrier protein